MSVLRQLHDELDAAVFEAYGWPAVLTDEEILERVVQLNAERVAEERMGTIRWLRPEFQSPAGAKAAVQMHVEVGDADVETPPATATAAVPWPKKAGEQFAAVRDQLQNDARAWSVAEVTACFKGAKGDEVEEALDGLASLGIAVSFEGDGGRRWKALAAAA